MKRLKFEYISVDEMNEHLNYIKKNKYSIFKNVEYNGFAKYAFINETMTEFKLTYKDFKTNKTATYICLKTTIDPSKKVITGADAFIVLSHYYKIPICPAPFSVSAILYKNNKYEGKRIDAISYDLNSAFPFAMLKDMPDTSVPPKQKIIEEGEIGFGLDGELLDIGDYSLFVFKLIESPFKKFVEVWYNKKKNAITKEEKSKAKSILNYSVGFLQRKNPYLRAAIIGYSNKLIEDLIDENTVYCNTDSIICLKERDDLKLGNEIGEWKVEHKGKFAFIGFNYQWNNDIPSYRGQPKEWFPEGWDILKDQLPLSNNIYKFDEKEIKIVKVKK